jgi:LysM domain
MSSLSVVEGSVVVRSETLDASSVRLGLHRRALRAADGAPQSIAAEPWASVGRASEPRFSSNPTTADRLSGPTPGARGARSGTSGAGSGARPAATGSAIAAPRVRSGSQGKAPRARVRLTRRGRAVAAVLIITGVTAAALLISLVVSGGAQATNHGQARAGYQGMREIVVRPGQTLWSIASKAEPSADPRTVVAEIMSANALTGTGITAGQLLYVPR